MHSLLVNVVVGGVCLGLGYGVRGWIGRKIKFAAGEIEHYAQVLEASLAKEATAARNDVVWVLTAIKSKL